MRTIGDLSRLNARRYADKTALVMGVAGLSYRDLDRLSNRLANAFTAWGVTPGDRIALLSHNRLDFAVVTQAVAKSGALLVPMNFRLQAAEIRHVVTDAQPKILVMEPLFRETVTRALRDCPVAPRIYLLPEDPASAALDGDEPLDGYPDSTPRVEVEPSSPCVIMYTSGTTGFPKGVLFSHAMYQKMYAAHAVEAGLAHEDVYLMAVPLFHAAGLNMVLHQCIYMGATGVIHRGGFDPEVILGMIEHHRVSVAVLVPMMVSLLAHHPRVAEFDLASLRRIFYGSAPITPNVLQRAFEIFPNAGFVQFYGSTECGMITTLRPADHPRYAQYTGRESIISEHRVVRDDGSDCAPGEIGEVIVRQAAMGMIGYWRNEAATAETVRNGWIYSGDLARVEPDGFITLVDRRKEVIISGGENIYPKEVENVLSAHPAVREVAVFGVPHDLYGETVCAAVAFWDGKAASGEEIIAFCKERLASFKCPKKIDIVDKLPRNSSDKIQKRVLKFRGQFR